ncbi:Sapep family Mn(2+)-dependent dipeptidase [Clostridium tarantellae]|uniref:Sapep family Mn(2+)-dependent dipeptidase n=1 Tax=Clostridium tarantellae TaxID=39493 RepID=A0A6I1MJ37_9CLOT|nr:Sapep family Mn(2+)-dependent dipeptidase [Clostridium tarantellae]MPQ42944.1 Sapep family Mn(2+)-dependent dipeptidase [Clostridium tarantellae]
MENRILNEIDTISKDMIESIIDIVKIDSVKSQASLNAPFGEGIKEALEKTLELAASLGLKTKNIDNYIGYASYGQGAEYVCAIGHLDVVPVGVGWKQPPFSGYIENDIIYSRGILDNKGPIISCLFALYALKRLKVKLKHEVRVIFGCDEESGFKDLTYYLEKEKPPIMGFTPDCKYPVVYGERGRAVIEIKGKKENMKEFFNFINEFILNAKSNGERLNINVTDKEFGTLEVRNYKIIYDENPSVQFSVSYPAAITKNEILKKIKEAVSSFEVSCLKNFNPVKFNKECFLVNTLKNTYEKVTGLDGTPVTTTGGTYAKLMPNIVPFGPSFPGQKGIGHNPNEWMSIEDIITNAKIYALSLYHLSKGE